MTTAQQLSVVSGVETRDSLEGLCWLLWASAYKEGFAHHPFSVDNFTEHITLFRRRYAFRFLANPFTGYWWPRNEWGHKQRMKYVSWMKQEYLKRLAKEPDKKVMTILVACEESQTVTIELRRLGHNAYSCDLLPSSGGHPEWHIIGDVIDVIYNRAGTLETGTNFSCDRWDMMIAHPPCTYLSSSGARWYYHPEDKHLPVGQRRPHPKYPTRAQDRDQAIAFFKHLASAPIDKIAIENPVGIMSSVFRKPDQIIQPFMFGDQARKTTCLWLKGLPLLKPTNIVSEGERVTYKSGKSHPKWYADAKANAKTPEERRQLRSKTFPGIAKALAVQWTK